MSTGLDGPAAELMVALMEKSAVDLAYTTNALIEGYRRSAAEAEVELELIRDRIDGLLCGPYQPSETAIRNALYPRQQVVQELVKRRLKQGAAW